MKKASSFLFSNIPLSIIHFVAFLFAGKEGWTLVRRILGEPGFWATRMLGASYGGILFWAIMVVNSLLWGAVLSLIVFPFLRKIFR